MSWTTPITDRTAIDIQNSTKKAFFNVSDWMRIYRNTLQVHALVKKLFNVDIPISVLDAPTLFTIPKAAEINALVANIEKIRIAAGMSFNNGTPSLKADYAEGLGAIVPDYVAVNQWERNLELLRSEGVKAADMFVYSGIAFAGDYFINQWNWRIFAGYLKPKHDKRRYFRAVFGSGVGMTRGNRFRSLLKPFTERKVLSGLAVVGAGLTRNYRFRSFSDDL